MKGYLAIIILIFGFAVFAIPGLSIAQEAKKDAPAAPATPPAAIPEEETEYTYGTVSSVSADQLVIKEYDYDNDQEVDITYTVGPDAKIQNAASLKDIVAGDSVEIDYVVKDGKRIVRNISVEKPLNEGAPAPGATGRAAEEPAAGDAEDYPEE